MFITRIVSNVSKSFSPKQFSTTVSTVRFSPAARAILLHHSFTPENLQFNGTGRRGLITKEDVLNFLKAPKKNIQNINSQTSSTKFTNTNQKIPQFYLTAEVPVDSLLNFCNEQNEDGLKIDSNSIIVRATALAVNELHISNDLTINVTQITNNNNSFVTIANLGSKGLQTISNEINRVSNNNGDNSNSNNNGTIHIYSALNGVVEIEQITEINKKDEMLTLTIGTPNKKIIVNDEEQMKISDVTQITVTADIRLIDEYQAALFLQRIVNIIKNPYSLLLDNNK